MKRDVEAREREIREHLEGIAQAIRDKDLDALMAHYAPDVVVFDVLPPLDVHGASAYRQNFERWFASVQGPIDYQMRGLHVTGGEGPGLCRFLAHVKATTKEGPANYWVRVTTVLEIRSGEWQVTHEHVSMPAQR